MKNELLELLESVKNLVEIMDLMQKQIEDNTREIAKLRNEALFRQHNTFGPIRLPYEVTCTS